MAKRYSKAELRRAAKLVRWDHTGSQPHQVQRPPRSRRRRS